MTGVVQVLLPISKRRPAFSVDWNKVDQPVQLVNCVTTSPLIGDDAGLTSDTARERSTSHIRQALGHPSPVQTLLFQTDRGFVAVLDQIPVERRLVVIESSERSSGG